MKDKIVEILKSKLKIDGTKTFQWIDDVSIEKAAIIIDALYSAGEEVSAEEFLNKRLLHAQHYSPSLVFLKGNEEISLIDLLEEFAQLTLPTVSEEEIEEISNREFPPAHWSQHHRDVWKQGFKAAIKELLNR